MITIESNKEYDLIYADPPWNYDFSETENREIENHYPTMETDSIKDLDVPKAENCVLYMWATAPKLEEALEVMNAWGFEYKTHAMWDKKKIGMGYWFRGQHELLLVGTSGSPGVPDSSERISSVFRVERGKHSSKPVEVKRHIEKVHPDKDKIELFSRDNRVGWEVWGNEAPKSEQKTLTSM